MGSKRASLDLDDDIVDIEELAGQPQQIKHIDKEKLTQIAEQSGFISREPGGRQRRRRKKSPFTDQQGIRLRPGMKDLFQDLGEYLNIMDHTTFERAILALAEKEGTKEHIQRFKELTE